MVISPMCTATFLGVLVHVDEEWILKHSFKVYMGVRVCEASFDIEGETCNETTNKS